MANGNGKLRSNWRTNLGSTVQSIGTSLIGLGVVPSLTSMTAAEDLKWVIITGYILQIVGTQMTGLFAADARVMAEHCKECHPTI